MQQTVLAKNIKSIMAEKKLRPTDLMRKSGIHLSRIGDIVSGKTKNPQIDTVVMLADGLGVSVDDLLGRSRKE